jgi:hypothetical protein
MKIPYIHRFKKVVTEISTQVAVRLDSVVARAVGSHFSSDGSQLPSLHIQTLEYATSSIDLQLHEVLDDNADGVITHALKVRHECDELLSLGISDRSSAKASVMAQQALQLANFGRGVDLSGVVAPLNLMERCECVKTAMTMSVQAESLLATAKKDSRLDIRGAIAAKQKMYQQLQQSNLLTV